MPDNPPLVGQVIIDSYHAVGVNWLREALGGDRRLLLSENVYPDLPASVVEDELGFRADGSRVEDDAPGEALPFEVPGHIWMEAPVSTPPPSPPAQ